MKTDTGTRSRSGGVAVEVGADWFKLVQVDAAGQGPVLTRLYAQRMDEPESSGAAIARALRTLNVAPRSVIACLPRHAVTIRLFELPSSDAEEIADMIDLQISRHTPYARDEIVLDYRLMGAVREGYTRVMLAIAQNSVVRQRFRLLEEAGLEVERMTVTTEGLLGAASAWGERMGGGASSPYLAVLDVDSGYSEFLVLQFGAVVFSRSIGVGAHHLLNDRARWEEKFVQEVAHALEAYRAESSGAALAGLGLSGAGMRVGWLGDRLRAGLDLAVTPHDCLVEVPPAPGVPAVTDAPYRELSLTALIGAAVDHARLTVNLTPDSVRARRALAGKARALAGFGMLAMAVLSLGSAWIVTQRFQRDARLRILKSQIDATAQEAQEIELMRRKVDLVAARLDAGPPPVNLLSELHALVPPPIYVTSLQMEQGGAIVIRGVADGVAEAVSDILRFVSALEASPHFENAKATRTATVRGKTEFEVTCGAEYRAP